MKAYERLLKYVVVRTPSDENSDTVPSSKCQFDLAKVLVEDLKELGVADAFVDEQCYVYGHLPATPGYEDKSRLGLIAHMDTVADYCDHDIVPVVTENFNGNDYVMGTSGRTISAATFPHLSSLKGRTLITSDGTTVLGADDKAGIAEIMTMIEQLNEQQIPHGPISIGFNPDEEIGTGAHHFDIEKFGADFAYTMDGGPEGEIQYENFTAAKAHVDIVGFNVHPGSSKDTMINAGLVANEVLNMLPSGETPRGTEGYEGFFHLFSMTTEVAEAHMDLILRDFDQNLLQARKNTLTLIEKQLNEKWGEGTVKITIEDQYRNMREVIEDGNMHLIENATKACEKVGIKPLVQPIRGGTDGAQLSWKGLPCPNLGTGGYAYHGPYEHITAEAMDLATEMLVELVQLYA